MLLTCLFAIPNHIDDNVDHQRNCTYGHKNIGKVKNCKIGKLNINKINNITLKNSVNEISQTAGNYHHGTGKVKL